ncbi:ABC-type transport auxiliary lipoprotein family protein [Neorhizobium galegae]|uniref:ABC-type transport auxiliary lipoprotein family protein n=1 Tax=Neorhizobium galegae TaxID=399 RepID=UPI000627C52E|nr:ABC-type transport auxiliary lipoprotein family protein [Neorhizobium galegae]MCQ1765013.1 ABC-type transport auxiliary lipoprotein family protein [Neorhizobium galegae]MCQ1843926.1 ABC-type transport auxiliary lipoprotein family protein [Neorhizobium galegae]
MTGSELLMRRAATRASALLVLPLIAALVSGCGSKANNDTFDLSITPSGKGASARNRQILVPEPTALKLLNSEQVIVRVSPSEIQYLADSRWGDRLPALVQSKLVEAFENSGRLGGVGKPGQGLAIDYQVVTDIRAFEVTAGSPRLANVEISAKILNDRNGTVRAQSVFKATSPVSGAENRDFIEALDRAFAKVGAEIVDWSLKSM